ncbi:SAM-dependent methyltransferase [Chitinophaga sp. LS1]|uniref:class I SAM-dependent methyltransferase n=1 Tax=Chitinophaga sp. LS1 TaxID=3051176 RepID=UPI002AAA6B7B|nr:SAM-dependent methyltransferase [Chitinophaga sp. LS1]WPV66844.1 SAM-dependent methyltransferase [Chitinophaga sp. LS1]
MRLVLASRSAAFLALFRAIASNRLPSQRRYLFHDPYAKYFLPPALRMVANFSALPGLNYVISKILDTRFAGALTSCLARTRLIDVMVLETIHNYGINQLIIFGAGYDCRIHRLDFNPKDQKPKVQFVEIDHPYLQDAKREVLEHLKNKPKEFIDYIPVDFSNQQLETTIPHHLFKEHYKTLLIWEGVTNSLTIPIADKLFQYFSKFTSGTRIIFIYIDEKVLTHTQSFLGTAISPKELRQQQEFWNFGMDPSKMKQFLAGYNMELLYDVDADTYRHTSFGKSADKMNGLEYYRVVMAVVK